MFRIGFGFDAHRLVEGRRLILGGVAIPHTRGLDGHSDADVLTHAVIDAVIGALGMGDLGRHFPDTDPAYKDANSLSLLRKAVGWANQNGLRVNNADATIIAEEPRLASHVPAMTENLARALGTEPVRINVKATTTEAMGFCGRKEGIAACAVISLIGEQQGP
ncbi:MAG: 2-C-methyl-D-erythritol 2,4-cyclodiphosphate synthase [Deltaproteobacteria bacterium]|nr:MAG: 2-C-methyl-D-erythritol 2,4-cyclodiphosphate synthase [Deltaproteobacteria bacterium]